MGILPEPIAFVTSLKLPAGFSVCELGDQRISGEGKGPLARLASEWYAELGCGYYESIDGNGRGTLTADLNLPLAFDVERYRARLWQRFDLVTDFGTGEHIFDQAQVWRTLHDLCKPGGVIVFDRPTSDFHKHCFYLINECVIRDLAAANGYDLLWLARAPRTRGELIRGAFRRPAKARPFVVPQQGKYTPDLVIGR